MSELPSLPTDPSYEGELPPLPSDSGFENAKGYAGLESGAEHEKQEAEEAVRLQTEAAEKFIALAAANGYKERNTLSGEFAKGRNDTNMAENASKVQANLEKQMESSVRPTAHEVVKGAIGKSSRAARGELLIIDGLSRVFEKHPDGLTIWDSSNKEISGGDVLSGATVLRAIAGEPSGMSLREGEPYLPPVPPETIDNHGFRSSEFNLGLDCKVKVNAQYGKVETISIIPTVSGEQRDKQRQIEAKTKYYDENPAA